MQRPQISLVIEFFKIEPTRLSILSTIGELARFIFANSKVPILPENLAIVVPVDDEPGIMHGHELPKAAKADDIMKKQMIHFSKWNATFGYLLANSDLFFDQDWS
jgi:hypothetical protein